MPSKLDDFLSPVNAAEGSREDEKTKNCFQKETAELLEDEEREEPEEEDMEDDADEEEEEPEDDGVSGLGEDGNKLELSLQTLAEEKTNTDRHKDDDRNAAEEKRILLWMDCQKCERNMTIPICEDSGATVKCKECGAEVTIGTPLDTKPNPAFHADQMVMHGSSIELIKGVREGPWVGKSPWWYELRDWNHSRPEYDLVPVPKCGENQIWVYNPTYGSLQLKALNDKPLDEQDHWVQSYVSQERALKESERKRLLSEGKIGTYPDEFYLVGKLVSEDLVHRHLRQVKACEDLNHQGPKINWRDTLGNKMDRLSVNFVPGPIVDGINGSDDMAAITWLYKMMCSHASSKYRNESEFQKPAKRFAAELVAIVRKYATDATRNERPPWIPEERETKTETGPVEEKRQPSILDFSASAR